MTRMCGSFAPARAVLIVQDDCAAADVAVPQPHPQVTRDKSVWKPAPGTRKCNCKQKVVTQQIGPGMYQQYTTQVGTIPHSHAAKASWSVQHCGEAVQQLVRQVGQVSAP